jgi:hypothetical protein
MFSTFPVMAAAAAMWLGLVVGTVDAANQTSTTYRVVADVFSHAAPGLANGAGQLQMSISLAQRAIAGSHGSPTYGLDAGYQATSDGFDSDRDGTPDNEDPDDDNDGVPDGADVRPYDTDNDGQNNVAMDTDDDNDTFSDWTEDVVTGTDPVDPDDCLKMLDVRRTGMNAVVSWKSVAGRNGYGLQRSATLYNPGDWQAVSGPVSATGGVTSITDTNAPPHGYYRVVLPGAGE